ncbi:MAG: hypothetical protein ABI572_06040 [Actinomycetota bacterium]
MVAAVRDADKDDIGRALVALDDLVSDTGERAADVLGVEQLGAQTATPPRAREEAYGQGVM